MPELEKVDYEAALDVFRRALAAAESTVTEKEQELAAAREDRNRLAKIIRAADPAEPGPGRSNGGKPRWSKDSHRNVSGKVAVSDEKVDEVERFLRRHYGSEEFYGAGIMRDEAFARRMSEFTLNKAILVLNERGVIRLDRVDPSNRRHIYKLTEV
ncbi:MAG TPA: hypothetical protein VH482_38005 [Thermomicrobiales bacterium]|jgi:hypothetical protein